MNGDLSQGGDGIISGAVVEANTIYDNGLGGGSGINCDGVQSSIIRNNVIYDNHASGISLYQIDGGQPARNNQVLHNTIVMASDARWAINIQNASTGNVVRNNILYNQHSFRGSIAISADSLPGFVSDTNVVMDRLSTDGGDTRLILAAWRGVTGQDTQSIVATPAMLFVDFAADDYHLSSTSPARDAGATLPSVTDDREGAPRPQGPASDIGAFEFPAAPTAVSLTVTRTGSGSVASSPAGISCGSTCSATFASGNQRLDLRDTRDRLGVHGLVGRGMLGHRHLRGDAHVRDDGERRLRAGARDGHGGSDRPGQRQRHELARRHRVRHDLLGELPVEQHGRAHRDTHGRRRLRGLVGWWLLGHRHLYPDAYQRDDRHGDLRARHRRAHGNRHRCRDRDGHELARRPHV